MNRSIFKHLWLLPLLLSWTGCSVDLDDYMSTVDGTDPVIGLEYRIPTMIRFETAEGDNLLAAFDDVPTAEAWTPIELADYPWLDIRCVRERDGAQMTFSSTAFGIPQAEYDNLLGTGPLVAVSWIDFDHRTGQNAQYPCEEKYTLHVRSSRLWAGEERTITWTRKYLAPESAYIVACAIDGEESEQYLSDAFDGTTFTGMVHLRPRQATSR